MRLPRAALPLALALLVAALAGVAGVAAAPGAPPGAAPASAAAPGPGGTPALQEANGSLDDPGVTIEIQLRQTGDARFTVAMAFPLVDERDRAAFRRLARDFERGDADLALGFDAFRRAGERANATTDRDMGVARPDRTATVENGTGVLRLSFTWSNFASQEGDPYRIGDAFNTTDGTWLRGLDEDQTLVVRPPRGYAIHSAPAGRTMRIVNGTMHIEGPATFEPGFLQASYQPTAPATTTSPGEDRSGLVFAGVLLLGLAVLALAAYTFSRRGPLESGDGDTPAAGAEAGDGGTATAAGDDEGTATAATDTAAGAAAEGDADEGIDLELLSDEERVEHLLQQNGGRMKQANIVRETGWSNAKVSQLLSSMAEEDRVKKLRIGRENLIALPDEEIGEFES